jgi:hypothetical protein
VPFSQIVNLDHLSGGSFFFILTEKPILPAQPFQDSTLPAKKDDTHAG